jgi:hypothetical protein
MAKGANTQSDRSVDARSGVTEQREKLDRDGYLLIDPEIPAAVIDSVLQDLESEYVYEGHEPIIKDEVIYSPGRSPRIRDAWRISDNVKRVARAPKILSTLEALYGRRPLPFQTLNFPLGTQQAPHSDAMHFVPEEPVYMCGVWVALEDVDMDNGPLIYYPGSHRLPFTSAADVFDIDRNDYETQFDFMVARNRQYEQYIATLIDQHGFSKQYGTLNKGEALIWSSNLLHGGAPREDKSRTRHSQVTHYLFEGSWRYRTPMRTEGEQESWTEPTFID